jgi:predicted metal-dependent peptidase
MQNAIKHGYHRGPKNLLVTRNPAWRLEPGTSLVMKGSRFEWNTYLHRCFPRTPAAWKERDSRFRLRSGRGMHIFGRG